MHNISTVYRFKTPFLDINQEKDSLISVLNKIKLSLKFDGISFDEKKKNIGDYYKITLNFNDNLGKVDFFYVNNITECYLPIFKLNIFINNNFLLGNEQRERAVKFLTNIFECFDGLNEKEYLIDLDNSIFYKSGFFKTKKYPHHDFSELEKIKNDFENKNGMLLLENFISKFKNKDYHLTNENSDIYHRLHGSLLYFIYLVFLIYQNLENTNTAKKELNNIENTGIYEGEIDLMKERLSYVDDINMINFNKYKDRLNTFFKLF